MSYLIGLITHHTQDEGYQKGYLISLDTKDYMISLDKEKKIHLISLDKEKKDHVITYVICVVYFQIISPTSNMSFPQSHVPF